METLFILVNKTRLVLRTSSTLETLKIVRYKSQYAELEDHSYNHDDVTALSTLFNLYF